MRQKRRQDQKHKQTLRTVPAPDILPAADIAAAENAVILRHCGKKLCDLIFAHRAQEAEIQHAGGDILFFIFMKIPLESEALGILMIDRAARDGALIGARLVRQHHIPQPVQICRQHARKRHDGGKRRVTVEKSRAVQFQHGLIQCAVHRQRVRRIIARRLHRFQRRAAGVDDIAKVRRLLSAQKLQRHRRVLASAVRHETAVFRHRRRRALNRLAARDKLHEAVGVRRDAVAIEKLAQPVEIQPFPPGALRIIKRSRENFHPRTAAQLPIAHKLHHAERKRQPPQRRIVRRHRRRAARKRPVRRKGGKPRDLKMIGDLHRFFGKRQIIGMKAKDGIGFPQSDKGFHTRTPIYKFCM